MHCSRDSKPSQLVPRYEFGVNNLTIVGHHHIGPKARMRYDVELVSSGFIERRPYRARLAASGLT
jgi:hypothetical protein